MKRKPHSEERWAVLMECDGVRWFSPNDDGGVWTTDLADRAVGRTFAIAQIATAVRVRVATIIPKRKAKQ